MAKARERRCIVSRALLPETRLVRFVASPDGVVTPDPGAKLPGRGAWVEAARAAVETAARKNAFSRAFERAARAPDGLADDVERLLAARCLARLGLARRSGALALGFDQVRALLRDRAPGYLVEACDGAADGRGKVLALARAAHGEPPLAGCFSAAEIGEALGREAVAHVAFEPGAEAARFAVEIERLGGFRALVPKTWAACET